MYQGIAAGIEKFTAPFRALGPMGDTTNEVPYPEIFRLNGDDEANDQVCGKGLQRHLFPVRLERFDLKAQRKVYNVFNRVTRKYPEVASKSIFLFESYSNQGVTDVPEESTAFPFRSDSLLMYVRPNPDDAKHS